MVVHNQIQLDSSGTLEDAKLGQLPKVILQHVVLNTQKTFAPVAKLNTVKVLLSLAANLDP